MELRGRSDPGRGSGGPKYPGSFLLAFREATESLGWRFDRLQRDVAVCTDGEGEERVVGLENLYRRARRTPRDEWATLAAGFLRTLELAADDAPPERLEDAAEHLLFRLGRPLDVGSEDQVWSQPLPGTNLVINLVIDYPDRMCYVGERLVAESGHDGAHWLARAEANLLARTPTECFVVIDEESGIRMSAAADAYDSSRALLLDQLLPQGRDAGNLVVLPGRDEMLVMPVTPHAMTHFRQMKLLAEKNFQTAPYPITDELYWVHAGVWRQLRVEMQPPDTVNVYPPPELMDVLGRLSAEGPKTEPRVDADE
jgi:hypothetical protein